MLENNQTIEGLDLGDVFSAMLRETPWAGVSAFIQANAKVHKRSTLGGHRLDPKRRKRSEKIIVQEAEKGGFEDTFCTPLFAEWYPVHEQLHSALEEYFHSDEYKKHREDNELGEDAYVLPDAKFDELFSMSDLQKWRILLAFSPLQFSKDQAEKILGNSAGGNAELLDVVEKTKSEREKLESELTRLQNENADIRERLAESGNEAQVLRQERKELKAQAEALQNKFDTSQSENRKLREELDAKEAAVNSAKTEAQSTISKNATKLTGDLERLKKDAKSWQTKYEEQCGVTRSANEKLQRAEKVLAEERIALDKARKEINSSRSFVDLLLKQIDWADVGRQMKLTPQLKARFKSLVQNLRYDDENIPRLDGPMQDFWEKFQAQERLLVERIAKSDTLEVQSGDVESYWNDLTDLFEDVHIGLEARNILLQMLQEVFYQTLDLKNLKAAKIPAKMATASR
jgi:predicted nuclease with TOPRIM domain